MAMLFSTRLGHNCRNWDGWVVIVADGAEWIWRRAWIFPRRCENLDLWHCLEKAWAFARVQYGEGCSRAEAWIHPLAQDLKAGKVQQ